MEYDLMVEPYYRCIVMMGKALSIFPLDHLKISLLTQIVSQQLYSSMESKIIIHISAFGIFKYYNIIIICQTFLFKTILSWKGEVHSEKSSSDRIDYTIFRFTDIPCFCQWGKTSW